MKNLTVIDAINDLIKGVNIAYSRQAYTMLETREIINAIEFLGETIKAQQQAVEAPVVAELSNGPSEK
jgi:DNA-binding transcriptional regulator YhcF (GntR family)